MFFKRRFARWLTKVRLFLVHPLVFNGVKLVYFVGLTLLMFMTFLSPSFNHLAQKIQDVNLSKTTNKKNQLNPMKSEIHILNSFYLNTEQSAIDRMNPVSIANLTSFVRFFIEKNEFIATDDFNFFISFRVKYFRRDSQDIRRVG